MGPERTRAVPSAMRRWSRRAATSRIRWRGQQLAVAAAGVSSAHRFVAGELRGGTRRHLTRGGRPFLVRHGTRDVDIVAEVLGRQAYRMPAEVRQALGASLTVVDAGANIGLFGVYAIEEWPVGAGSTSKSGLRRRRERCA
jgi:hypothetical protein